MIDKISLTGPEIEEIADPILVVDDEEYFLSSIQFILGQLGYTNVHTCSDSRRAMDCMREHRCAAVLLDISMPNITGIELLDMIRAEYPDTPVIMITAIIDLQTVVDCIRHGAYNYILKPLEIERLASTLKNAFDQADSQRENSRLRERMTSGALSKPDIFADIITQNESLAGIFSYIEAIAPNRQPVLITGETGTGKELIARALHDASGRTGRFVAVNIGGLSDTLIDDELFGHVKGGFTGAVADRTGMIDEAADGTLFLDEIGDLSLPLQVKLLRLIQEQRYQAIGSNQVRTMSARIVVATNHMIEELVQNGSFRKDLYYRLFTHRIHLLPLRERKEDIPLLLERFLEQSSKELSKKTPQVPVQLYTLLETYDFPGNVRELQSMVFDAVSRHEQGTLSMAAFREKIETGRSQNGVLQHVKPGQTEASPFAYSGTLPTLKQAQDQLIEEALNAAGGNQSIAAGILGMSRRALNSRLSRRK